MKQEQYETLSMYFQHNIIMNGSDIIIIRGIMKKVLFDDIQVFFIVLGQVNSFAGWTIETWGIKNIEGFFLGTFRTNSWELFLYPSRLPFKF